MICYSCKRDITRAHDLVRTIHNDIPPFERYYHRECINDAKRFLIGDIKGVGPDAPLETLESGAKQSKSPYRFDLLDAHAMFKLTELLAKGAEKYGVDNWRSIPTESHLNHMIVHAYAYLAGDRSDDHLTHMLARALFAVAVDEQNKKDTPDKDCPK